MIIFLPLVFVVSEAAISNFQNVSFSQNDTFVEPLCHPRGGMWHPILRQCFCRKNYYGDHCENIRNCFHGTAFNDECRCDYGWQGETCHQIKCYYGQPVNNFTECQCNHGIAGIYCDSCKERYQSPPLCSTESRQKPVPTVPTTCSTNLFNYYLNILLLVFIASYFTIDRVHKQRIRQFPSRRLEAARNVESFLSPEMQALMLNKHVFHSDLQPCPKYEEAVFHPIPTQTAESNSYYKVPRVHV
uniref:EGF-like domain-containing protein n=1 Tax=Panagrolaimus sp. JU765 TaxID=591449 RepID=A0AC34RP98_9BILA